MFAVGLRRSVRGKTRAQTLLGGLLYVSCQNSILGLEKSDGFASRQYRLRFS